MSKVISNSTLTAGTLRLAVPRDGQRSRQAPLLYTERDLSDAVRQAVQRGREEAGQEAEAFVRRLDRSVENALEAITYALEGLESRRAEVLDVGSNDVLDLALLVARAVVGSEIDLRPESVETVVDGLLEELRDAERVTIRMAPETLQSLRDRGGAISDDRVRWVSDAGMGPSDARVDSDRGGWDASLETRWRRITEAVRNVRVREVGEKSQGAAGEEYRDAAGGEEAA